MSERFTGGFVPSSEREPEEKHRIGDLEYRVETTRKGKKRFDFGRGFNIGFLTDKAAVERIPERYRGYVEDGEVDLRDLIAFEADTIRTDNGLCIPETELRLDEKTGMVSFTLPGSNIDVSIYQEKKSDDGRVWHTVEPTADAIKHLELERARQHSDGSV